MKLSTTARVVILAVVIPALAYIGIATWIYLVRLAVKTGE